MDELLASAAAVQKAAVEKKAVEAAEEAKRIGEQGGGTAAAEREAAKRDGTEANVGPAAAANPAGPGASAHALQLLPGTTDAPAQRATGVNEDVLMEYTKGSDQELASAAELLLDNVAKKRKVQGD